MVVPWVLDEMKTADLKDRRLNNRLREVLSRLGGHPTLSIPAACGGHTEMLPPTVCSTMVTVHGPAGIREGIG